MFATPVVTLYPGSCFCCCCPCFRIALRYEEKTWGSSAHFGTGGVLGARCDVSGRKGADIPIGAGVVKGIAKLTAGAAVVFGTAGAGGGLSAAGGYIVRNLVAYVRINAWYLEKIPFGG
jgi:streptolysin S family bacteriocin protoxin